MFCRSIDAPVRWCGTMVNEGVKRGWSRPKITWKEVVSKVVQLLGIKTDLSNDMAQWKKKIHIGDSY